MTQYLQLAQGRSAIETGLIMLPLAFGLVIGSGLSHKVNLKLGTPEAAVRGDDPGGARDRQRGAVAARHARVVVALFFFVLPLGMGNVMAPARRRS